MNSTHTAVRSSHREIPAQYPRSQSSHWTRPALSSDQTRPDQDTRPQATAHEPPDHSPGWPTRLGPARHGQTRQSGCGTSPKRKASSAPDQTGPDHTGPPSPQRKDPQYCTSRTRTAQSTRWSEKHREQVLFFFSRYTDVWPRRVSGPARTTCVLGGGRKADPTYEGCGGTGEKIWCSILLRTHCRVWPILLHSLQQ